MSLKTDVGRLQHDVGELLAEHGRGRPLEEFEEWADDPVGFDRRHGRDPVDYQCRIMESVRDERYTVVRGCHASGKEWTAGSLAVWAAYARRMLVLIVSATERQVLGQTMREVRSAWRAAPDLPGQLFTGSVRIDGEDRIIALTGGANIDALTGWHDPAGVLVIISEGQGERLEDSAYDAAIANATDEFSRILAMGNPVRPMGRFFEINRKPHWNAIQVSAFDTPNVKAGRTVRPGFPSPDWPAQVAQEYGGESSPYYRARVLAEFPTEAIDGLVERQWLDEATEPLRRKQLDKLHGRKPWRLVVDVARYGKDRTVMGYCLGPIIHGFETWRNTSLTDTAERIQRAVHNARWAANGPPRVVVDDAGVGGGVTDTLKSWGVPVDPFNGAAAAAGINADKFANARAQSYFAVREALRKGEAAIPDSEELREELLATTYFLNGSGRIQVAPKDEIKAALGRSPDFADVVAMAMWAERSRGGVDVIEWG